MSLYLASARKRLLSVYHMSHTARALHIKKCQIPLAAVVHLAWV